MARHPILKMGDPRLLTVAKPVTAFDTPELHQLIADLRETMAGANGAGLAAPQIGVDRQVVLFGSGAVNPRYPNEAIIPATVLINPVITPIGEEEQSGWEGCLSVPGLRAVVPRWMHILYTGFDEFGRAIERTASGFHARVAQHECDHLIGKLYPMRVRDFSQFGYVETLFPELSALEGDDD
ncbi:MAG: peptide deformylase [Burkholderiaceae bacterium]|nr:peptide deformylase [Burkholderiaceae bacterium]